MPTYAEIKDACDAAFADYDRALADLERLIKEVHALRREPNHNVMNIALSLLREDHHSTIVSRLNVRVCSFVASCTSYLAGSRSTICRALFRFPMGAFYAIAGMDGRAEPEAINRPANW